MVFYFTGTGNSLWVANVLAKELGEPLVSIAEALQKDPDAWLTYTLQKEERILFVYPVHSWGPAVPVIRFIARLSFTGYEGQPVYSVCTCGDECGYTDRRIRKALAKRSLPLTGSYSVQMPNNYIILPGFSVDSPEVEKEKLSKAPERLRAILKVLESASGQVLLDTNSSLYHKGSLPLLKSGLIYPLFINFAIGKNAFYATDACISCGLCARICPTGTIVFSGTGKPQWTDTCVQCLACIHRCPAKAIEYGRGTHKKGRYCHPQISQLNKADK